MHSVCCGSSGRIWTILLVLCVLGIAVAVSAATPGWSLVNPSLTGSALKDAAFISPDRGWAVGENGVVLHTTDSGRTWAVQQTPVAYPAPLFSAAFIDSDTGYAVGGVFGRTFALETCNGGATWQDVTNEFPQGGLRKICVRGGNIWVTRWGRTPNISISRDRCASWHHDTIGNGSFLHDVLFVDGSTGYACGDIGYVGKTTDGGATWRSAGDSLRDVYQQFSFPTKSEGYCLGMGSRIAKKGSSDTLFRLSLNPQISGRLQMNTMAFVSRESGFALGSFGPNVCVFTPDAGGTWEFKYTSIEPQVTKVSYLGGGRSIGICWNGAIHEIWGLADSSKEVTSGTGGNIRTVDFFDSLRGLCGSDDGSVFATGDAGATWTRTYVPDSSSAGRVVAFANGRALLFTSGRTFISTDYGASWLAGQVSVGSYLIAKAGYSSLSCYSDTSGRLAWSSDAGSTWAIRGAFSFANQQSNDFLQSIAFTGGRRGWALTFHGAVSYSSDSGYTWHPGTNIPNIFAQSIYFADSANGWVCGFWGSMYVPLIFATNDGGSTWSQASIQFALNLAQPTDWPFQAKILKIQGHSLSSLWALSDRGVLVSSDSGKTWLQQTLPQYGKTFSDMFCDPNGTVFVVGDNARIWKHTGIVSSVLRPSGSARSDLGGFTYGKSSVYNASGRRLNGGLSRNGELIGGVPSGQYFVTPAAASTPAPKKAVVK